MCASAFFRPHKIRNADVSVGASVAQEVFCSSPQATYNMPSNIPKNNIASFGAQFQGDPRPNTHLTNTKK